MSDDELEQMPPGLFFDPEAVPVDVPLTPEEEESADAEIASIRRLETVRDADGELPAEGEKVLVFRNEAGEPIAVPAAVVTEAERAYRVYKMWLKGETWMEISRVEGYPSPRAAKADMDRYLAEGRSLVVASSAAEMVELELARLTSYTLKLAERIDEGVIPAITEARQLAMARVNLVTAIGQHIVGSNDGQRTVVVPVEGGTFVATLREAAEDSPSATEPDPGE